MAYRQTILGLLVLATGCAEWPRYEYIDESEDALEGGEEPGNAVDVHWMTLQESATDNDRADPDGAHQLEEGMGYVVLGRLNNAGWDAEASAHSISGDTGCGGADTLPPEGLVGNYTGDVDWFEVKPTTGATLCGRLELKGEGSHGDLLAYALEECATVLANAETGAFLGLNSSGRVVDWSINVAADTHYGVMAASVELDMLSGMVLENYVLSVALVAPSDDGEPGLCPVPDVESVTP